MPRASRGHTPTRPSQRGSATVYVLALVVVLLTVAVGAGALARLVTAKHRAAAAADLAALAGAHALAESVSATPCTAVVSVARRNGGQVVACSDDGSNVIVTVAVAVTLPFGYRPSVEQRARAGPAP